MLLLSGLTPCHGFQEMNAVVSMLFFRSFSLLNDKMIAAKCLICIQLYFRFMNVQQERMTPVQMLIVITLRDRTSAHLVPCNSLFNALSDVNECEEGTHHCSSEASTEAPCINTKGSFKCRGNAIYSKVEI